MRRGSIVPRKGLLITGNVWVTLLKGRRAVNRGALESTSFHLAGLSLSAFARAAWRNGRAQFCVPSMFDNLGVEVPFTT